MVSVFCLTGRGGSGKTRFALELVHHIRGLEGWDAYFVRFERSEPFDLWNKTGGTNHALLVFDYASDNAAAIAGSLRLLAEHPPKNANRKLRILLLARTASWKSGWLKEFEPTSTLDFSLSPKQFFRTDAQIIELEPLSIENRIRVFREAYEKAAEILELPVHVVDEAVFRTKRADEMLRDPLTLMMAALVGLRNGVPNALLLSRVQLVQEVAGLLVTRRLETAFPENEALILHLAAYATLSMGLTHDQALEALDVESQALHLGSVASPSKLVERMAAWFPGKEGDLLGAIEPDVVGEAFVLDHLAVRNDKASDIVLRAAQRRAAKVIQFLNRATQGFNPAEVDSRIKPQQWLESLIAKGEEGDFGLLIEIDLALPSESIALSLIRVRILKKILFKIALLVDGTSKDNIQMWLQARSRQAWYLHRLSVAQWSTGQREEALSTALQSVQIRQELADQEPDLYLRDLIDSLNNLGNRQSEMGQLEAALETALKVRTLYLSLTERHPNAISIDQAMSYSNLANRQSEVGQYDSAVETAQEGVRLCRLLVEQMEEKASPALAMALSNFGNRQSEVGLHQEALESAEESLAIRRDLAKLNPDSFRRYIAMSLNNLSSKQSKMAQREAALASILEAVSIYRSLIKDLPDAFLPDLARSLRNLAAMQIESCDLAAALESASESFNIRRDFVNRNPVAFARDFEESSKVLGQVLAALQRSHDAKEVFEEGLKQVLPQISGDSLPPLIATAKELMSAYEEIREKIGDVQDTETSSLAKRILGPFITKEISE